MPLVCLAEVTAPAARSWSETSLPPQTTTLQLYRSSSNTYCSPDRTLHFLSHRHLRLSRHPPHKSTLLRMVLVTPRRLVVVTTVVVAVVIAVVVSGTRTMAWWSVDPRDYRK
ncbi:uncharacterized protein LOC123499272 [Portunus trituberculatus]|uniref:uncharacterized protein LOC123499272 n=1 Tax=Portunus trituberculatus TaxID=210409 RepID=UPI001E1D137E|nr:uncharacterized protein LOC123499272 [Portunus trituberculatus]